MCWLSFAYAIILAVVGELLRPKARLKTDRPKTLGDFTWPTAEAGRAVAAWGGTILLPGMNTTAADGLRWVEQTKRVKTGLFSSSKQHLSWAYFITIQMTLGRGGLEKVWGVQVDEKFLKTGQIVNQTHYIDVQINDESFYGDHKTEGGFSGLMRFYKGTPDQPIDLDLKRILGQDDISAYPYMSYVMFVDFYIGNSTNPSPFSPVVSKWPNTLGLPDNQRVINDTAMNPMCWAYYLMTENVIEAGIPASLIDVAAFRAAGTVLFNEKIGMNHFIDTQTTLRDALDVVEEAIDGKIFEDPFTGLWTVTLARQNYDVTKLLELNESNSRCVSRTKTDWWDLKNTFNIIYKDKDRNWSTQSVSAKDQAALAAVNQLVIPVDVNCDWCDNIQLAQFLAERARVAGATPFTNLEIEADGRAEGLRIGDPFVARYPNTKRIAFMVCRVTDIEYAATDEGVTRIKCAEDKFGTKIVAYTGVPSTKYVPPTYAPAKLALQLATEFPYGATPDGNRSAVTVATIGGRAGGVETSYDIYAQTPVDNTQHFIGNVDSFAAYGTLSTPMSRNGPFSGDQLVITGVTGAETLQAPTSEEAARGLALAMVEGEWISYTGLTVTGTTVALTGVLRSPYDTTPSNHAQGASVVFLDSGIGSLGSYSSDFTTTIRLPTKSFDTAMSLGATTPITFTTQNRAARPYRPGNVKLNGSGFLSSANIVVSDGVMNVSWNRRNRLTQDRGLIAYDAADVAPEANTTYRFRVYRADTGALLATSPDFAGTSGSFTVTGYVGIVTIRAWAVRDTLESFSYVEGSAFLGTLDPIAIAGKAPPGFIGYPYDDSIDLGNRLTKPDGGFLLTSTGNYLGKPNG